RATPFEICYFAGEIDQRRFGAGRAQATAGPARAARGLVRLKARNALIARVGLLGLLTHYHGVIGASDRTQRALETESGALSESEFRRCEQDGRGKAR